MKHIFMWNFTVHMYPKTSVGPQKFQVGRIIWNKYVSSVMFGEYLVSLYICLFEPLYFLPVLI